MSKHYFLHTEGGGIKIKPQLISNPDAIEFVIIDLFCGAGGTTQGFDMAMIDGKKIALVAACVNHDWKALKSHWQNHPEVIHFEEDIRTLDLSGLVELVAKYRQLYPNAKIILWASLECTNFSKAKGGLSRDPDSRTLAVHLPRYISALDPDYIQIENVVEFMSWGPVRIKSKKYHKADIKKGTYAYTELKTGIDKKSGEECYWWTPISKLNGTDWMRWRETVKNMGYDDEWKQMNAADYGGYTTRNRLFGCFAKPGLPVIWPETSHSKKPPKPNNLSLFDEALPKQKWKACKDVLDLQDEGETIFNRIRYVKTARQGKGLLKSGKTVKELYAYPVITDSYVEPLILTKENLTDYDTLLDGYHAKHGRLDIYYYDELADKSLERTYAGLTKFVAGMTKKAFLLNYNSAGKNGDQKQGAKSMEEPCPTIPTQNRLYACFINKLKKTDVSETNFLVQRNSGDPDGRVISINGPARALTATGGNQDLAKINFLTKHYSGHDDSKNISLDGPAGTLKTKDSHSIANVKFLVNYQGTSDVSSINTSAPSLLTRDKLALENICFLANYYSNGDNVSSVNEPASTVRCGDGMSKIQTVWIQRPFSGGGESCSINDPAGSITGVPKLSLMRAEPFIMNTNFDNVGSSLNNPCPPLLSSRRHYYLVNPSYWGHASSIQEPCPVIIARQDKTPLYLIQIEFADVFIPIYESDTDVMRDIKVFMALYGISDIKMRMLKVKELLAIQGFPDSYQLFGNQSDQKKFIGNSVHPLVPKYWAEAMGGKLREIRRMAA